jgi:protein SCO1/2
VAARVSDAQAVPVGGQFELVDHHGRAVAPACFAGRHMLVFFGFTNCRGVCPRELGKLTSALDQLGPLAEKIQPLYVSVDPERDTPDVMKAFLLARYPRFLGLTGTRDQTDAAKRSFRVFAQRREDPSAPGGYDMPHTAIAYLLDEQGRYVAHFPDTMLAEQVASRLSEFVR